MVREGCDDVRLYDRWDWGYYNAQDVYGMKINGPIVKYPKS